MIVPIVLFNVGGGEGGEVKFWWRQKKFGGVGVLGGGGGFHVPEERGDEKIFERYCSRIYSSEPTKLT